MKKAEMHWGNIIGCTETIPGERGVKGESGEAGGNAGKSGSSGQIIEAAVIIGRVWWGGEFFYLVEGFN